MPLLLCACASDSDTVCSASDGREWASRGMSVHGLWDWMIGLISLRARVGIVRKLVNGKKWDMVYFLVAFA